MGKGRKLQLSFLIPEHFWIVSGLVMFCRYLATLTLDQKKKKAPDWPLEPLHGQRQRLVELLDDAAGHAAVLQLVRVSVMPPQAAVVHHGSAFPGVGGERARGRDGQLQASGRHADHHFLRRKRRRVFPLNAGQLQGLTWLWWRKMNRTSFENIAMNMWTVTVTKLWRRRQAWFQPHATHAPFPISDFNETLKSCGHVTRRSSSPMLWFSCRVKGFGGRAGGCLWKSAAFGGFSWTSFWKFTVFLAGRTRDDFRGGSWGQTLPSMEARNSIGAGENTQK